MSVPELPRVNASRVEQHYELGEHLGSGAYSVVLKATERDSARPWAIKVVDKSSTSVRDMAAELCVMATLTHPNIVAFKEVFDHDDGYYVVLELISGGELFDRIVELRRFTEKDAAQTMRQAFRAVQHVHASGYVHRDVKPENLLLSDKSATAVVKLADFGFATKCHTPYACFDLLGTPEYMAPELVAMRESHAGYGKPVDVWALGVVLYILLSGVHPFQMDDDEQMLDNIQAARWTWLGRSWPLVSDEAKDLITRMLERNPRDRLTVDECLEHAWFTTQGDVPLADVAAELKKFQARKRLRVRRGLRGAIHSVIASNKMRQLMGKLSLGSSPAPSKTSEHTD